MAPSTSLRLSAPARPLTDDGAVRRLPLWREIALTLGILCRDPLGGIRRAERRVGDEAAGGIGLVFGLLADAGLVLGLALLLGGVPVSLFVQLLLCGLAPLGGALLVVSAARRLTGRTGRLRRELYVVGTSALPLGAGATVVGLLGLTHGTADVLAALAAFVLAVLLLYNGCRYVLRLSTLATAVTVPLTVALVAAVSASLVGSLALAIARPWLERGLP